MGRKETISGAFYVDCCAMWCTTSKYPNTHCLAKQGYKGSPHRGNGRGHGVVSAQTALRLRSDGKWPKDALKWDGIGAFEIQRITKTLQCRCPRMPEKVVELKVLVVLINSSWHYTPTMTLKPTHSDLSSEEVVNMVYYGEDFYKKYEDGGYDTLCFVTTPMDGVLDGDLVCAVWVGKEYRMGLSRDQEHIPFMEILASIPKSRRFDDIRQGGSNGKPSKEDPSTFMPLINPGRVPRMASAVAWTMTKIGSKPFYISPYSQTRTLSNSMPYTPTKPSARKNYQRRDLSKNNMSDVTRAFLEKFTYVKALTASLLHELNCSGLQYPKHAANSPQVPPVFAPLKISRHAQLAQATTNCLGIYQAAKLSSNEQQARQEWYHFMMSTCTFSLIGFPVQYHYDRASRSTLSDKEKGQKLRAFLQHVLVTHHNLSPEKASVLCTRMASIQAFVENKQHFRLLESPPLFGPSGRGGGGEENGKVNCLGSILDHPATFDDWDWQDNGGDPMNAGFFNALVQAAHAVNIFPVIT
jgi:hypothetical protein